MLVYYRILVQCIENDVNEYRLKPCMFFINTGRWISIKKDKLLSN